MSEFLVKFNADYADEFNIKGFSIFSSIKEWEEYKAEFPDTDIRWCFGTNEQIEWETKEDFLKCFSIQELNSQESQIIKKLFRRSGWGFFPS